MFCYQCQETAKNSGCTLKGVCGKTEDTANLQDLLMFSLKGLAACALQAGERADVTGTGRFVAQAMFATITNANFDSGRIIALIRETLERREEIKASAGLRITSPEAAVWFADSDDELRAKAPTVGILTVENEDIRSLRELLTYGMKGVSAYAEHASRLGYEDPDIYSFLLKGLDATTRELSADEITSLVMECGGIAVKTMALLDRANTQTYGSPEITKVNIGVRGNPGILVSGHDLKDFEQLLKQTEGTSVDVYTHCEMLPANYYPAFKKYSHFVGNYGNAWWKQNEEFEQFGGPILMTTNCIIPVKDSYKDRIFTTSMAGYPGVRHIPEPAHGGPKDFSEIISLARTCRPPVEIETGEIVGGFAHDQVMKLADKVVDAVKSGAVKRFVVMAGCDGRFRARSYFTEIAQGLPEDTVILTAGCAKYRYNKLPLGDIGGIPRVLDAGQCNDSYSLAVIAMKLKEVFGLQDINDLPISYDIAWYEQKAVAVLLALLALGVKHIRLGPTLPGFLSPNVARVLVEKFDIKPTGDVQGDLAAIREGR
ncbi:MAG TPA: hydroxylamine reductase [Deltaproteobacteria bacterium]|nr:hydroxylamine reductase [Deltaproteobacteria bacterium]